MKSYCDVKMRLKLYSRKIDVVENLNSFLKNKIINQTRAIKRLASSKTFNYE